MNFLYSPYRLLSYPARKLRNLFHFHCFSERKNKDTKNLHYECEHFGKTEKLFNSKNCY